jgi:hypothetical protein
MQTECELAQRSQVRLPFIRLRRRSERLAGDSERVALRWGVTRPQPGAAEKTHCKTRRQTVKLD